MSSILMTTVRRGYPRHKTQTHIIIENNHTIAHPSSTTSDLCSILLSLTAGDWFTSWRQNVSRRPKQVLKLLTFWHVIAKTIGNIHLEIHALVNESDSHELDRHQQISFSHQTTFSNNHHFLGRLNLSRMARNVNGADEEFRRKRNQPCLYFKRGNCKNGEACLYKHDASDPRKLNQSCRYFERDGCKKGEACPY
jgi:hypothetical protein